MKDAASVRGEREGEMINEIQPNLFAKPLPRDFSRAKFKGETFDAALDQKRLSGQLGRVYEVMKDGRWRTLAEIAQQAAPGTEAAISARLRDLRRKENGGYTIERERVEGGLFRYRMI